MADIIIPKFREWLYPIVTETRCVKVRIPDSDQHAGLLAGVMALLTKDENWQAETGETTGDLAAVWDEAYLETDWEGCEEPMSAFTVGMMLPKAGATLPTGWLWCNGAAISRTTYADLFAEIGITYGNGDGSTTFNLPNTVGQVVAGAGQPFSGGSTFAEGVLTGTERIVLSVGEMPTHSHVMTNTSGGVSKEVISVTTLTGAFSPGTATTYPAGSSQSHNNMQPTAFVKGYIIYAGV